MGSGPLFNQRGLPMKRSGGTPVMQVTVEVTDEFRREAEARGLPIVDFVEMLVHKGLDVVMDRPEVNNAMERIRALRSSPVALKR